AQYTFFSGICAVASGHFRKYHFVKDEKSWFDAQSYCREKHTDLATIESQAETEKLNISAGLTNAWIGLYYDKENWQWSNGDNVSYYNWTSSLNCTSVNSNGEWVDSDCNKTTYSFICYNDTRESYILIDQLKTWYEAQQYCRKNYTDLVSIKNNDEDKKIKEKANGTAVWIGLFNNPWKWSHKGEYSSFHNWNKDEPNNLGNNFCVEMYGAADKERGKWNDAGCHFPSPFFCYNDGKKLFLVNENKTWEEAVEYCRSNHTDLVSIESEQELQRVYRKANKASSSHVWLGLLQSCTFGFWYWVDGAQSCYDNWAQEPRCQSGYNQCGVMTARNDSKWTEKPCTERFNFICYNGKRPGFVF
ncbi:lymphocyte antigen 75-like, partial [Huso huso]